MHHLMQLELSSGATWASNSDAAYLGSLVVKRAHASSDRPSLGAAGQAEVCQTSPAAAIKQQVLRLDVSMHQALRMCVSLCLQALCKAAILPSWTAC